MRHIRHKGNGICVSLTSTGEAEGPRQPDIHDRLHMRYIRHSMLIRSQTGFPLITAVQAYVSSAR